MPATRASTEQYHIIILKQSATTFIIIHGLTMKDKLIPLNRYKRKVEQRKGKVIKEAI